MTERALLFVDGNNWYHGMKSAGVDTAICYERVSRKLVGPRRWCGTRYYVGAVSGDHPSAGDQRRFLAHLSNNPSGLISVHLGRVEGQIEKNPLAQEVGYILHRDGDRIPEDVKRALEDRVAKHHSVSNFREKATDVMIAIDICRLAWEDQYDTAYLLSADGDFTPAVSLREARARRSSLPLRDRAVH